MWNSEFEEAERFVRLISIPKKAVSGPVFIEVPEGTTFRNEIRWQNNRPVIMASCPTHRNMVKLRLCVYRIADVPVGRDICGPYCLGTFYMNLGKIDTYVAFLDANVAE